MEKIATNCKVCGKNLVASYDETCPALKLEVWTANLTCNRCFDFEIGWMKGLEKLDSLGAGVSDEWKPNPEVKARLMEQARVLINRLTDSICDYLGTTRILYSDLQEAFQQDPRLIGKMMAFHRQRSFKHAGWRKKAPTAQTDFE